MSGGFGTTWLTLLEEKELLLKDQGCEGSSAVRSEAAFRTAFEDICKRYREKWSTRLLANLLRSYGHITTFASAIGAAAQLASTDSLTGLVWWASLAAIESGCKANVKLDGLVHLLGELNSSVPQLGPTLGRYPNDTFVQSPLQDLFGVYIDAYIFMVSCFSNTSSPFNYGPIEQHIKEAATKFEESKNTYDKMLDLAEQHEARERLRYQQQSLTNGLHDESFHNDDTRARFRFQRRLGRGSFGDVSEVQEMSTGAVYARKLIHFDEDSSKATIQKNVLNEVTIMQKLRHQHIASVLFFVKEPGAYSILMLPVADSDLLMYLERCASKNYPISLLKRLYPWFGCLLDALAYAHKLNINHRDIKPSNILIKDGQLFLADFGVAKDFTKQEMSATDDYFVKGTPVYRAPETRPDNPRGPPADIFALGCVFSEMLTVRKGKSPEAFRQWRRAPDSESGMFAFRANLPKVKEWISQLERDALSEQLVDHITGMLHEEPDQRPTAQESLNFLRTERALFCASH